MAKAHSTTFTWSAAASLLFALAIGTAPIAAMLTMEALR
jgi:hypothetical protein